MDRRLSAFVDSLLAHALSSAPPAASPPDAPSSLFIPPLPADAWSCAACKGVPEEPSTAPCGHCYCRACLERALAAAPPTSIHRSSLPGCAVCGGKLRKDFRSVGEA